MSEMVIELSAISKSYKKENVIKNINLNIERGHIVGLIGPNGAGKTTILKMLAGLTEPDVGKIRLFDSEVDLEYSRKKMSFMIEEPIIDPMMTAKKNMKYVCYVKDISLKDEKIEEILTQVGLGKAGRKKAKNFSLGMKQRLGIGMALLNEPEVLVLDEPMNGLDPEGIVEIRCLLQELAKQKKVTILISSHILPELEELCTDYAIINQGKVIESASMEELMKKSKHHLVLGVNEPEKVIALLQEKLAINNYQVLKNKEIIIYEFPENIESISKVIMEEGISISRFSCEGESLEQYYLSKVGTCNG